MKRFLKYYLIMFLLFFSLLPNIHAISFGVAVPDYPYTLMLVMRSEEGPLTPAQKSYLMQYEKVVRSSMQQIVASVGKFFVTGGNLPELTNNTLGKVKLDLENLLASESGRRPTGKFLLTFYFLPWQKAAQKSVTRKSLEEFWPGIPNQGMTFAEVEFERKRHTYDFYYLLKEGVNKVLAKGYQAPKDYFFVGTVFNLIIDNRDVSFELQTYGGFKIKEQPFIKANPQVDFTHMRTAVPRGDMGPTVLMTMKQRLNQPINPKMKVLFGRFGGFSGGHRHSIGNMIIYESLQGYGELECDVRSEWVPQLIGKLGANAVNTPVIKRIIKGMDITFKIFDFDFDLQKLEVTRMNIPVRVSIKKCLEAAQVNRSFALEANNTIKSKISNFFEQDDLTDELLMHITNKKHYTLK